MPSAAALRAAAPLAVALLQAERAAVLTPPPWAPQPHQVPPAGPWACWLLLAGRGAGKTRAMVQYVRDHLVTLGSAARVGVGAPTIADARDVCAEGASGLMTSFPREFTYNRSLGEARHCAGGYVKFLGSEQPGRWNGPQWTLLWWDELALCNAASYEQSLFGLRLGTDPRLVASTTPKGSNFVRALAERPDTAVTRAATRDNPHLAASAVARLEATYGGTRLGQQELDAAWLDDLEGALWRRAWLEAHRQPPDLTRVVIGVDPAATSGPTADETGIVVCGRGIDGYGYVLADRSCRLSPDGWARRVIAAYDEFAADRVIVEVNNGGEMVSHTLRTVRPELPITMVHASRGKATRAEPVAALYEQGRVHHVAAFPELADQLCTWTPDSGQSPDRLDALVWACTALLLEDAGPVGVWFA